MLNFNSILLSSEDYKKLADFYGKVFDKKSEKDEGYLVFVVAKNKVANYKKWQLYFESKVEG